MRADKEYKKAIEQAKANYADFLERGDDAIGGNWNDLRAELFTHKEIAQSDLRIAKMMSKKIRKQ